MNRSCMHCDSFPVYYADKYDQLVFMQKFQDGRQYCNNLAAVKKNGKWGFMDRNGNIIISMMYDWVVSTQFRASPFERALFSALNRVLLINQS